MTDGSEGATPGPLTCILEQMSDAFVALDGEWRFTYLNREAERVTGHTREALLGRSLWEAFPDLCGTPYERHLRAAVETGKPQAFEEYYAGLQRWFEKRVYPTSPGLAIYFHDVTARKREDAALRQREKLYSTLIHSLRGIVWEADGETFQFSFVSPQAEQILGYPTAMWLADPNFWRAHTHPEDVERCVRFCRETSARGEDHQFEYRMIAADGRIVWLYDIVTVRRDPDGSLRLCGIMLDITDRKRVEEALKESEQRYRSLALASAQIVWTTDAEGKVTGDLPEWRAFTGQSLEAIQGEGWLDAVHPEDRLRTRDAWEAALRGRRPYELEGRLRARDGSYRLVSVRAVPVLDDTGAVREWVGASTDVTERAHLEEQLRQAQRMEAVGQLAGGVAHDFNNLLTVITGYADLLLFGTADTQTQQNLEEIRKAADRATLLTQQLLAFSRKQVLHPQVIDLNFLLQDMSKMLGRLIGEHITLQARPASRLDRVLADPGQLQQVIMNLAVNARDAMPFGGTLSITTRNRRVSPDEHAVYPEVGLGAYVSLAVEDTGTGMSADVQARVFEPFFTTKGRGKGTGLGLSTVYGIVRQLGGCIRIDSELGRGTRVEVLLPSAGESAPEEKPTVSPRVCGGSETLLLVEDEEMLRELARSVLERGGYRVLAAADAAEALQLFRRDSGPIHLLVTDVVMPGLSGPELAARLEAFNPNLKVLYVSGYTDDAILHHGVLEAGVRFLQKPFSPETLAATVRDVLDTP